VSQRKHISQQLDEDLEQLKQKLLDMGNLVDQQVACAISVFVSGDHRQAADVVRGDDAVNQLERVIDQQCINLLARWQPEASDLRFVAAVLKIVTDLERIGDLAVSTAEQADQLDPTHRLNTVNELSRMVDVSREMLRRALQAFIEHDEGGVQAVLASNRAVKVAMQGLTRDLRNVMYAAPALISNGLATISVAKHAERMAAHAANIAEMVVYIARGVDVRHTKQL
jgi:phosphate transport system protein